MTLLLLAVLCYTLHCYGQSVDGLAGRNSEKESLILGGRDVRISSYRYTVRLEIYFYHEEPRGCGGAALSTKVILTAAHCLIKIHPHFNDHTMEYDVGLVAVKIRRFRLTYRAARLPRVHSPQPQAPQNVTLLGWGSTSGNLSTSDTLKAVTIPVVDHRSCVVSMRRIGILITRDMFCAGDLNRDPRNSCFSDSGGPVVNDAGVLVGIISGGPEYQNNCTDIRYPSFHVDVAYIRQWIRTETGV